jgi:hypothetical protein
MSVFLVIVIYGFCSPEIGDNERNQTKLTGKKLTKKNVEAMEECKYKEKS